MGTGLMKENDIEHLIEIERATLRKCVNLLQNRIPLADWPDDVRTAFLLAVRIKDEKGESYKAFRTARHLRLKIGNLPDSTKEPTPEARRCAERIRADLVKLVKLGAAEYLGIRKGSGKFQVSR